MPNVKTLGYYQAEKALITHGERLYAWERGAAQKR